MKVDTPPRYVAIENYIPSEHETTVFAAKRHYVSEIIPQIWSI